VHNTESKLIRRETKLANQSDTKQYSPATRDRNYIFVLLFLLYFFDYADRMIVASLLPFIQKEFAITDAEGALLIAAVSWAMFVFAVPLSILVDRWSRKKMVGIMALFWSVWTAVCAFMPNFKALVSARAFIGLGEAAYAPAGTAFMSALYPPEKRARMMGIWNASVPLGTAFGIALGGVIAAKYGWRSGFGLVAIPGFIVAILFFFVKDYKTVGLKAESANEIAGQRRGYGTWQKVKEIFKTRTLIFCYLGFASVVFVNASLQLFFPTYLVRTWSVDPAQAGVMTSIIMLGSVIGAPLGGYLADLWYKKRKNAQLLFSATSTGVTALLLLLGTFLPSGTAQYIVFIGVGLSLAAFVASLSAAMQGVVHPGLRAVTFAISVLFQHLLGQSLGPIFTGVMSDNFGIKVAFMTLPAFLALGIVFFLLGARSFFRDHDRVEKVELQMA
jgi:predicted MFS family arabinose efflux permease